MAFTRRLASRRNVSAAQPAFRAWSFAFSAFILTILLAGCDGSRSSPAVTTLPVTSGTRLLFDSVDLAGNGTSNIFPPGINTIAPDGSNVQRVINDFGSEPRFSADGTKIVYTTGSGTSSVVIANADGTEVMGFPHAISQGGSPALRPDGKAIVFLDNNGELSTVNVDGSQFRQIPTPRTDFAVVHPVYTPDGSRIVYSAYPPVTANDTPRVHVINATGGKDRVLPLAFSFAPNVSPDGKTIVCAGFSNTDSLPGLFLLNLDGTGPITRIITANATNPVFSPDGSHIAFLKILDSTIAINGTPTYEIHIVARDGSGEKQVGTKQVLGTTTLDWR